MAAPQLLCALVAVRDALQRIAVSDGYFNTVPPNGVVLDPIELATAAAAPFSVLGGNLEAFRVTRALVELSGTRLQDTLTVPLITRLDVPFTSDLTTKVTAWIQWCADVERVLAHAAFGAGEPLNGLTVVAWPQTLHAPMMGTPDKPIVVAQIDIQIVLKTRVNGEP